jgi:predicted anti-sigma-YlaC factor YlaD
MNHQYFKEWLITDEPLTLEQTQKLEEHLKECNACQQLQTAWLEVQHYISVTPDVDPLPGFTSRWEERITRQHRHAQKRLTWIVFATLAGIAFLVTILLSLHVTEFIRSPQQITLVFLSRFAVLISYLTITKDYLNFVSTYIPKISLPVIVFTSGLMTLLCVLWLATMKQISSAWRIVK